MKPTLYLMMGYPGSGKTTASKIIAQLTGATHLWADKIRRDELGSPTYTHQENVTLYQEMNEKTRQLLASGKSVVFDTAFNFKKDRQSLRTIAEESGAKCIVIWLQTSRDMAKNRALNQVHHENRPVGHDMTEPDFTRMADSLELPDEDEDPIILDGTKITKEYVAQNLDLK